MAISPTCIICDKELDEPGGLLFGPPAPLPAGVERLKGVLGEPVSKYHLCRTDMALIVRYIETARGALQD